MLSRNGNVVTGMETDIRPIPDLGPSRPVRRRLVFLATKSRFPLMLRTVRLGPAKRRGVTTVPISMGLNPDFEDTEQPDDDNSNKDRLQELLDEMLSAGEISCRPDPDGTPRYFYRDPIALS
jgi:hypothetical protein